MVGEGLQANYALPTELRVTNDNQILDPGARARYEQIYNDMYLRPREASLAASGWGNGQSNSTAAGAALGQMIAMGGKEQMMAGEELYNMRLGQVLQKRDSFYNNEGNLASQANSLNVQRGTNIAQMMQDSINQANQYNLSAMGAQNQYGLNSYSAMTNAMNQKRESDFRQLSQVDALKAQNKVQGYQGLGQMAGGLIGAAAPSLMKFAGQGLNAIKNSFGGGSQQGYQKFGGHSLGGYQ